MFGVENIGKAVNSIPTYHFAKFAPAGISFGRVVQVVVVRERFVVISHEVRKTLRFEKDFEPLDVICECGYEERTLYHILFDRILFQRALDEARIDSGHLHPTVYDLFSAAEE